MAKDDAMNKEVLGDAMNKEVLGDAVINDAPIDDTNTEGTFNIFDSIMSEESAEDKTREDIIKEVVASGRGRIVKDCTIRNVVVSLHDGNPFISFVIKETIIGDTRDKNNVDAFLQKIAEKVLNLNKITIEILQADKTNLSNNHDGYIESEVNFTSLVLYIVSKYYVLQSQIFLQVSMSYPAGLLLLSA